MTKSVDENQGCLTALLRLLGIGTQQAQMMESLPYRRRDDFLSPSEISFYHVLLSIVGNQATVCPKVGLTDLFFVARPNENQAYRNRIAQKHLDFLLCAPKSMRPLVGIELDDTSHARIDREERDEFVESLSSRRITFAPRSGSIQLQCQRIIGTLGSVLGTIIRANKASARQCCHCCTSTLSEMWSANDSANCIAG